MAQKKTPKDSQEKNDIWVPSTPGYITLFSITLPFMAWLIGSLLNPTGWASDSPSIVLWMPALAIQALWPIAIIFAVIVVAIIVRGDKSARYILSSLLLAISVLYSIYGFVTVVTADEDEFA